MQQTLLDAISHLSETDLQSLPVNALKNLKTLVDSVLNQANVTKLRDNDLLLEYSVKLRNKDGVLSVNEGTSRMNSITSQRLIVEAPRRFESEFQQQVFEPTYADAMDAFDKASGTTNELENVRQSIGGFSPEPLPGLPVFGDGFGG